MVKKIQAAIEAVQKAESRADAPAPFNSTANKTFRLYCADHVEYCFFEDYGGKFVEFKKCRLQSQGAAQQRHQNLRSNLCE